MKQLKLLSEKEYEALKKTGMLYEFYPEASGNWTRDIVVKNLNKHP